MILIQILILTRQLQINILYSIREVSTWVDGYYIISEIVNVFKFKNVIVCISFVLKLLIGERYTLMYMKIK